MSHSKRIKAESCEVKSEDDESYAINSDVDEDYETLRERQIQANQALLEQLGLGPVEPRIPVKRIPKPKLIEPRRNSRRQSQSSSIVYDGRILKHRLSTGEYSNSRPSRPPPPPSIIYGQLPGVPVLRTWDLRCHIGPMHDGGLRVRTTSSHPAASLCLYSMNLGEHKAWQDSLDFGSRFTFISAYGNFTFGDRQGAGQVRHQTFEHDVHKSLLLNVEQGIEVRVIRGSRSSNCWAPEEGEPPSNLTIPLSAFPV